MKGILFLFILFPSILFSSQISGQYDSSFKAHDFRGDIKSVLVRQDDSIVVGGFFSSIDGQVYQNLAIFDKDSNLRKDINIGASHAVHVLSNGSNDSIIVGGRFKSINNKQMLGVGILDLSGSSDFFSPTPGTDNDVYAISASHNSILIGGKFAHYNKKERSKFAAINYNGTIHKNFNPHLSIVGDVYSILRTGGFIYVAGKFGGVSTRDRAWRLSKYELEYQKERLKEEGLRGFTTRANLEIRKWNSFWVGIGSLSHKNLAKITGDGDAMDLEFSKNGPLGMVKKICLQSYDKLLVVGDFKQYSSNRKSNIKVPSIVRISAESGLLDISFKLGNLDIDGIVNDVLVHPIDGKIMICGRFTTVHGKKCNRIARLNPDGTIDESFDSSVGADDEIYSMAVQSDGKIIIGGNFKEYSGVKCNGFARIIY